MKFQFESPLHDAIDQQMGQKFLEAKALLAEVVDVDPTAVFLIDTSKALRDALEGVGVPAEWINSEDIVESKVANAHKQEKQMADLQSMQQGADVAKTIGEASQSLQP